MCTDKETFYDLAERITDAFPEIDSDICTNLFHTDDEYAELRREADKLQQAHPIIARVPEGSGAISLSAEEHAALVRYIGIQRDIEGLERKHIYFRGHTDGFAYLKKIGAV
jgi:hypothetical protein